MNFKKISLLIFSVIFSLTLAYGVQAETIKLSNPLKTTSVSVLIGNVIDAVLGIVGSLALVMFIYGGFTWMTASGNEQSVTKGKNILMWAAVGLAVIFLSYALVKFIIKAIGA